MRDFCVRDGYTRDYEADECVVCQAFCGPGEYVSGHCTASLDTTECSHCPEHTYEEGGVCVPCLATPETCTGDLVSTCGVASESDTSHCVCGPSYCVEDDGTCGGCSHVRVYEHIPHGSISFGQDIAINDRFLAVGVPGYGNAGRVFVYERSPDGTWTNPVEIASPRGESYENFGKAVAFQSELFLIVGADAADAHHTDSGLVYSFTYDVDAGVWDEIVEARILTGDHGDRLGNSIDTNAEGKMIVGSSNSHYESSQGGIAEVWHFSESKWVREARFVHSLGGGSRMFGVAVAIDGNYAVVGSGESGSTVEVFEFSAGSWTFVASLTRPSGSHLQYGSAIAVEGDIIVVGAPQTTNGNAYVYRRIASVWREVYLLSADDASSGYEFGYGVAISDGTIFVGSPSRSGGGAVYVYDQVTTDVWVQRPVTVAESGGTGGRSVAVWNGTVATIERQAPYHVYAYECECGA